LTGLEFPANRIVTDATPKEQRRKLHHSAAKQTKKIHQTL
jgi:hypothetical protein